LKRYLGDASLAEDVFQNTFLQLYTKIHLYEPGRPVKPWLYTIATHQAIDARRRNARHHLLSLDQRQEDPNDGDVNTLLGLLESRTPGPVDQAVQAEQRRVVRSSVDRLPEFLRDVVILAYYQGLKYADVAAIMGIPVGTVKSRLHTALLKLNEMWTGAAGREPVGASRHES
jgi:RNA polymerase sigma-70 factor (ECF subfamily)